MRLISCNAKFLPLRKADLRHSRGFSIVELLIALIISLLALYAVYSVFSGNERVNRTITSVNEAQVSGMYSIFLLRQSIESAGVRIIERPNAQLLNGCPGGIGLGGIPSPASLSLRPLPLVIAQRTVDASVYDEIFVFSGGASRHVDPLTITAVDTSASQFTVNSPFGLHAGDGVIVADASGCAIYRIEADSVLDVARTTTAISTYQGSADPEIDAQLVDLGDPVRHHFYVDESLSLQMAVWRLSNPGNGQWTLTETIPVTGSVVFFRAQYGLDTDGDQSVDTWQDAIAPWDYDTLLSADIAVIRQIKTIRVALVVRVDEPEKTQTFNQATRFTVLTCPGGMTCSTPTTGIQLNYAPGTAPGGMTYRYRLYETEIPLRNTIWN